MTKQFDNLSKKKLNEKKKGNVIPCFDIFYSQKDVKEFIRELKEEIHNLGFNLIEATDGELDRNIANILDGITERINELAGKELIEDTHESGRMKGGKS